MASGSFSRFWKSVPTTVFITTALSIGLITAHSNVWSAIIRDQWPSTDFGCHQVDIQDQSDRGWTDYILKQRQKDSLLDFIDWANCHLDY
jgi:hypothetical protein